MRNEPDVDPALKRPLEVTGVVALVCAAGFLVVDDEEEEKVAIAFSFSLLGENDADFLTTPPLCTVPLRALPWPPTLTGAMTMVGFSGSFFSTTSGEGGDAGDSFSSDSSSPLSLTAEGVSTSWGSIPCTCIESSMRFIPMPMLERSIGIPPYPPISMP